MDLNTVWFLLVGVLIIGYAILDGFDFGVGVIHLFTKNEDDKRIMMNAIGPVWDGNEVWLLTGGGALFAAFPPVYATVFSGFYIALILLLAALIFRAVSFEFRGKVESATWRKFWDAAFGIGSLLPAILFGVAFGNILRGIPVDANGNFVGSFIELLNPYSILIGVLSLALFIMHGANYMTNKSEGVLRERFEKLSNKFWILFVVLYVIATFLTMFEAGYLFDGIMSSPLFWILFILLLASVLYQPVALKANKYFVTFLSSAITIASVIGLAALSLFPRLVPSNIDLNFSLTIYNSSSSDRTLLTMLIIALIGMPLVIIYTIFIYRVFKGKVVLGKESY